MKPMEELISKRDVECAAGEIVTVKTIRVGEVGHRPTEELSVCRIDGRAVRFDVDATDSDIKIWVNAYRYGLDVGQKRGAHALKCKLRNLLAL